MSLTTEAHDTATETVRSIGDVTERYVEYYAGSLGRGLIVLFLSFLWLPIFIVALMSLAPGVL